MTRKNSEQESGVVEKSLGILFGALLAMMSCAPSSEGGKADCLSNEAFDPKTRTCISTFNSFAPLGSLREIKLTEDVQSTIVLHYDNYPSNDPAIDCEIDQATLLNVAEVRECSCPGGVCNVELIGFPNTHSGTILYRFLDSSGSFGDYQTAHVSMTAVNDAPTFCPLSLAKTVGDHCENSVTETPNNCVAPGNPNTYTLGFRPDFTFMDTLVSNRLIFYDQDSGQCYYSDSRSKTWLPKEINNCQFTVDYGAQDASNCSGGDGNDCTAALEPVVNGDQVSGQVYWASETHRCYYFNGTVWQDISADYDQVIAVVEDTNFKTSSFVQTAYDVDDGPLDISDGHTFLTTVGTMGSLLNCSGANCEYRPLLNLNVAYDGKTFPNEGSFIDVFTLRAMDSKGVTADNTVAFIIRNTNDAPFISNVEETLAEGEVFTRTFTLSHDPSAGPGFLMDYDDGDYLKNIEFLTDATDPEGVSECLSGQSLMNDLSDAGGGNGQMPFTTALDNIFYCDTAKGVAQIKLMSPNTNSNFTQLEVRFLPNVNFVGDVKFKFSVEDRAGERSPTAVEGRGGLVSLTYTPVNDPPTFCSYTDRGHADCGYQGSLPNHPGHHCFWNESPVELSHVISTSGHVGSVYPNHGGFPSLGSLEGGATYYDQRNDTCYLSVAARGWVAKDVQVCEFSLDSEDEGDDCGAGSNCTGTTLPLSTPTVSGLVFYDSDDLTCFLSEEGVGWNLVGMGHSRAPVYLAHALYKVDENLADGTNTVSVDTTSLAKDLEGDVLVYTLKTPPAHGLLSDCPGGNCQYRPDDSHVGFDHFVLEASDGGDTEEIIIGVGVRDVNNAPTLTSQRELDGTTLIANEAAIVQLYNLFFDEGGQDPNEDTQGLEFDITSSNPAVLDASRIQIFWETDDNLYRKQGTNARVNLHSNTLAGTFDSLGDGVTDASSQTLGLRLVTAPGVPGKTMITLSFRDTGNPVKSSSLSFTLDVRPFGAIHNDWKNVFAVGPLQRKEADVRDCDDASERSQSSQCNGGAAAMDCTSALNPNTELGLMTYTPSSDGLVFFDSSNKTCWESHADHGLWAPRGCAFSVKEGNCNGGDCIGRGPPHAQDNYTLPPRTSGLRYSDVDNNICYTSVVSKGWIPEGSYIQLEWNGLSSIGNTLISSYQVFRRTKDFEYNYSSPVGTISSPNIHRYTDVLGLTQFSGHDREKGYVFFYTVLPVDAAHNNLIFPQEDFREITVVLPPYNMVMVPRRVVNGEICEHLQQTPDSSQDNRCSYGGMANTGGYFQLAHDLMIDRFEYGCDYTSSVVSKGECGEGLPCYRDQSPTGTGVSNGPYSNAFYDRSAGTCYVNTGSWSEVGGLNAVALKEEFVSNIINTSKGMKGRLAGLPPLTRVSQSKAENICNARTNNLSPMTIENGISNISLGGSSFRLPSRVEQVALGAWDTDLYTDSKISILEQGPDLNTSSKCNSSNADTVPGFSDAPVLLSSGIHALPGTASSSIRSLATGNDFTSLCASRYQVRSLIGNIREWSDERFSCVLSCMGSGGNTGSYDAPISGTSPPLMVGPYVFDGTAENRGPLVSISSWVIAEEDNNATFFDFPVALTYNQNVVALGLEIGQSSGVTTTQLHSDTFTVTEATSAGSTSAGLLYGGSYEDATGAGRYYGSLEHAETADAKTGFRCLYPISPDRY